jgi:uncharacterized DUF497 family protein
MDIFSQVEGFEWDKGNIQKSRQKHNVSPAECEEVFFNNPLVVKSDESHSVLESRFFVLGQTDARRLLFIAFTIRSKKIRVISARDMSRKERHAYDEETKNNAEIQK